MADEKALLTRLETVRKLVDDQNKKKDRLAGELDGYNKRLDELQQTCSQQYQCTVEELPALIEGLEKEAELAVADAENILGIGTVQKSIAIAPHLQKEEPPIKQLAPPPNPNAPKFRRPGEGSLKPVSQATNALAE